VTELLTEPFLRADKDGPALHRLWAKDRGDTESRPQALNAELRSWAVKG